MTCHAEHPLRCASILQILDDLLALATTKASGAKSVVFRENCMIFDTVMAQRTIVFAFQRFMASHAEHPLRCENILQILDVLFALATAKAGKAKSVIFREDRMIFDGIVTQRTIVLASVTFERADTGEVALIVFE